jgi:hypothetical protein
MNENVHEQLRMDLQSCPYFSVCLNESTDITSSACLPIILWFVKSNEVREAL